MPFTPFRERSPKRFLRRVLRLTGVLALACACAYGALTPLLFALFMPAVKRLRF